MSALPLVAARVQLTFPGWGDADEARALHMVGYYALELALAFENRRLGSGTDDTLFDAALDIGAAAWWGLDLYGAKSVADVDIVRQYEHQASTEGQWVAQPLPLQKWRAALLRHVSAVLLAPASGMLQVREIVTANLVNVVVLAEEGAIWINERVLGPRRLRLVPHCCVHYGGASTSVWRHDPGHNTATSADLAGSTTQ
jgi:hypothetical protein